jgi:uncharacterized protein (TIGR00251 family)
MIDATVNGVVVTVRVIPRSSRAGVAGTRDGALLVRLNAPPVEGAANEELVSLLAAACGVPKRAVTIVSGDRGRQKRVAIAGIDTVTAAQRLQ